MQVFSNIEIDGVLIHGKQDTGAEVNTMPLNVVEPVEPKVKWQLGVETLW